MKHFSRLVKSNALLFIALLIGVTSCQKKDATLNNGADSAKAPKPKVLVNHTIDIYYVSSVAVPPTPYSVVTYYHDDAMAPHSSEQPLGDIHTPLAHWQVQNNVEAPERIELLNNLRQVIVTFQINPGENPGSSQPDPNHLGSAYWIAWNDSQNAIVITDRNIAMADAAHGQKQK